MNGLFDIIEYRYHGVGQGLFASAALVRQHGSGIRFQWVYDCGTSSEQRLLDDQLRRAAGMEWKSPRPKQLDLVAISHFDKDHVSGLARLIALYPVHTLLLPFAPLAVRLSLAFDQGLAAGDPRLAWFADPIGYVRNLDGGGRIERIVLVDSSRGEALPPPDDPDKGPSFEGAEGGFELHADEAGIGGTAAAEEMLLDGADPLASSVGMLQPGGRLWVDAGWEFVPYNNCELLPLDLAGFQAEVAAIRAELLEAARRWRSGQALPGEIQDRIDRLKAYYDDRIGSGARERNLISLFLYAGPTGPLISDPRDYGIWHGLRWVPFDGRLGQLFTGDGYLDTPARAADLEHHLSRKRLSRAGHIQVMHHGAGGNWHKGVAAKLNPLVSIFSSDPERGQTYHPHAEVLRDFWPFNPVQVDGSNSYQVTFHVH